MAVVVADVLKILDEIAPPDLQEEYDNVGLLAGHPAWNVQKVMVALDLTEGLVQEAVQRGVQLIVTHHPIFFRGRKNIREDDAEGAAVCALIRARVALIAAHTNFDNAPCGVNDALAETLCLENVCTLPHGLRMGTLHVPLSAKALHAFVQERLEAQTRLYVRHPDMIVERVAVCGGAGGDFYALAAAAGAQALITGEAHYHDALAAVDGGMCLIEAGHYETEHIAIKLLAHRLQERADALQYSISVMESSYAPFWRVNHKGGPSCS